MVAELLGGVLAAPARGRRIVSPIVYGHLRAAISIASHIRSVRMLSAIAYPTAFFVQQPGTVARYTNPSQVRI